MTEHERKFANRLRGARMQVPHVRDPEQYRQQIDRIEHLAARADAEAVATLIELLREYVHAEVAQNRREMELAWIVLEGVKTVADIRRIDREEVAAERAELRKIQQGENPAELTRLAWQALATIGPAASTALRDAFEREEDPSVQWWLMHTLADIADPALRDFYVHHAAEFSDAEWALGTLDSASDEESALAD